MQLLTEFDFFQFELTFDGQLILFLKRIKLHIPNNKSSSKSKSKNKMKTVSRYYVYCDLVIINSLSFTMHVAEVGKKVTSLFIKFWRDNLLRSCPSASVEKAEFTGLSLERRCNQVFEIRPEGWFFLTPLDTFEVQLYVIIYWLGRWNVVRTWLLESVL